MTTPDRPFIAYPHEVRAMLSGRQTQFRRVVKLREFQRSSTPGYDWQFRGTRNGAPTKGTWQDFRHEQLLGICPFGQPGDRLWVRETFYELSSFEFFDDNVPDDIPSFLYHADGEPTWGEWIKRPSIHMPRRASRLTLEVENVRVERVQEISEADARAEGCAAIGCGETARCVPEPEWARDHFEELWNSTNGPNSWSDNPWVFAVNFRVVGAG